MKNLAGCDTEAGTKETRAELEAAGIEVIEIPDFIFKAMSAKTEVPVRVRGAVYAWTFERAWYYWVAKGPGLPLEYAMPLHMACGKVVRVDGHCLAPSPIEWGKGHPITLYHVDEADGLKALADAIKRSVAVALVQYQA